MALVNVLSKETERELVLALQQFARTAAALEKLAKNADADRARLMRRLNRLLAAAGESDATMESSDDGAGNSSLPD